jgi:hypothetical protein
MKKRNVKSLTLRKKSISKLQQEKINGGLLWTWLLCIVDETDTIAR